MLFIDANQYLNLFRMDSGKKLLAALEEQDKYIFVTEQIVNEVERNKVRVAASFLATKQLKLDSIAVPDHILSTSDSTVEDIRKQLREISGSVKKAKEDFRKLAHDLLEQIARSKDEVSKRLAVIFSHAAKPTGEEFGRAIERKRVGNPPGKKADSLGDQISWEQLLTVSKKDKPKLWFVTGDSDYVTEHDGKMFLNAMLYSELVQLYGSAPEVFCFDNIPDAFKHFSETTKVKADKLPTPEETRQIKKEQEAVSSLSAWLKDYDDGGFSVIQNTLRLRESSTLRAILGNPFTSDDVIFPTGTATGEKP
jgi:hypothetical protein